MDYFTLTMFTIYISKVTIPMKQVYIFNFWNLCSKSIWYFLQVQEYSIEDINDVCRQFWRHVWRLKTFHKPTNTCNNEVPNSFMKCLAYVFFFTVAISRNEKHGSMYSPFFLFFLSTSILYNDDVNTMAYVVDKAFGSATDIKDSILVSNMWWIGF